jgi:hypothetical protein
MEWIVMDDGTDKVGDLFDPKKTGLKNVRYVALPEGTKLKIGAKRNALKKASSPTATFEVARDQKWEGSRRHD